MDDLVLRERRIDENHRADAARKIARHRNLREVQERYAGPTQTPRGRCRKTRTQIGSNREERRGNVLELELVSLANRDQKFFSCGEYRVAIVAFGLRRAPYSPHF